MSIFPWKVEDRIRSMFDSNSNTVKQLSYEHNQVHSGNSFHCSDVQACDTTTKYYMVTTPNTTKWAHMMFGLSCTGEMSVTVTEGADRTGTTALTSINHNRNSATTSGLVIHRDYSSGTTNGADQVFTERIGSTGVASKTIMIGNSDHSQEYILKQNTKYIIAVTTYASVFISLELDWYEHQNLTEQTSIS